MKQDLRVSLVRISVHVHPTEVIDKVKQSLANLIAMDVAALNGIIEPLVADGDYGNKIHILNVTLKSSNAISTFFKVLKERIPDDHKKLIRQYFDSFCNLENKTLYIRFHKQLAFQGQLRVSQYDDILHVSIKFIAYTRQDTSREGGNILKFLLDQGIIA